MLRRAYYAVASIYIFGACIGLLLIDSNWRAGGRPQSRGEDHYVGLWPLPPEQPPKLVIQTEPKPAKPALRTTHSNTAAVHDGETLIRQPPAAKVVHSSMAAVHDGETLIKWPPAAKVVHSNMAAVHDGDMLIRQPPAAKVVHSNMAAVHDGDMLIRQPPAAKVVHSNMARVHEGDMLIKPSIGAPIVERRTAPPSAAANVTTGAVARQPEATIAKIAPKEASPQSNRIKRKSAETTVTGKQRRPQTVRAATESKAPDLRRSRRVATTATPPEKVQSRRIRTSDGKEVRRAVGQLNEDDRRAFRSRCGQILSAPGRFARSHVEICTAASL
jgi:hypothetical protein